MSCKASKRTNCSVASIRYIHTFYLCNTRSSEIEKVQKSAIINEKNLNFLIASTNRVKDVVKQVDISAYVAQI